MKGNCILYITTQQALFFRLLLAVTTESSSISSELSTSSFCLQHGTGFGKTRGPSESSEYANESPRLTFNTEQLLESFAFIVHVLEKCGKKIIIKPPVLVSKEIRQLRMLLCPCTVGSFQYNERIVISGSRSGVEV